jgi:hypothetical protein
MGRRYVHIRRARVTPSIPLSPLLTVTFKVPARKADIYGYGGSDNDRTKQIHDVYQDCDDVEGNRCGVLVKSRRRPPVALLIGNRVYGVHTFVQQSGVGLEPAVPSFVKAAAPK